MDKLLNWLGQTSTKIAILAAATAGIQAYVEGANVATIMLAVISVISGIVNDKGAK